MRVQEHILSPRFGGPIIGAIHDHISGAYLLTRKSMTFTEEQALQIVRKSHLAIPEKDGDKWLLKAESEESPEIEREIAKKTKNVRGTKADKEAYLNTLDLTEDEIAKRLKANKWTDDEKETIKSIAQKRITDEITAEYSSGNDDANADSLIIKNEGDEWTGKELFSLLLPNDLNLTYKAEICTKCGQCDRTLSEAPSLDDVDYDRLCPIDAYVRIKNGILKQGVIDEKAYGSMSGQILDKIVKEYGPGRAKEFLDRSTDLAICGIMVTGITTSLNDEEIPEEAQARINEHLQTSEEKVDKLIDAYNEGFLDALPGRSLEETLEMRIMQVLGEARDKSGEIAEDYLTMEHNHSVVMARTGARASMLNLTQITSCVGQQAVRGGRIHRGYIERTLPHFKRNELMAKAKGFVHSSYKSGLDPIEFFFHAMGGREGLVDTAIRTAQSGYMQRRLVNALQDLQVKPSGLVIDNNDNVIQRIFGDDGVDPAKSDFGIAANLDKLIEEMRLEEKSNEISQSYEISKPKPKIKLTNFSPEDLNKLDEYVILLDKEIIKLGNSKINSFLNKYSDFKYSLKNCLSKYNILLNELNSKKNEIVHKKNKLINNSLLIFNVKTYDYVNDYPSKVNSLLTEIDNKIDEIKNSEEFLNKVNRPELILKRNRLIHDIEKYINNINEFIQENNKNVISDSILDKTNNIIDDLKLLIVNLNKNYNNYLDFKSVIDTSQLSFYNLKSEFSLLKEKTNKKLNKYLMLEYQILFDEDIITKEEFNELKNKLLGSKNQNNLKLNYKFEDILKKYKQVKSQLNHRPSRKELFLKMDDDMLTAMKKSSKLNIFRDYFAFLTKNKELTSEEKNFINTFGHNFLKMIESTKMTKSYKMPIFMAFYNNGNIKTAITEEDVYECMFKFYNYKFNGVDMLKDKSSSDYKSWGKKEYIALAKKNPIKFLKISNSEYFVDKEGYILGLNDKLNEYSDLDLFKSHFKDIIEYKTISYYKFKYRINDYDDYEFLD
ncbi:hypothetical protein [uncultured Methanobrevibacter sp.]|uniref:hypothetical protein n=1 Tax=uncultured Methanobrevibacter sp. TaxID=253161 RepID=UPI00342214A4